MGACSTAACDQCLTVCNGERSGPPLLLQRSQSSSVQPKQKLEKKESLMIPNSLSNFTLVKVPEMAGYLKILPGMKRGDCGYCTNIKGSNKRLEFKFKAPKVNACDADHFFESGFVGLDTGQPRTIYQKQSCCEVFDYRVNIGDFKISGSQKKAIRRFHRFLNHGARPVDEAFMAKKKQEILSVLRGNWKESTINEHLAGMQLCSKSKSSSRDNFAISPLNTAGTVSEHGSMKDNDLVIDEVEQVIEAITGPLPKHRVVLRKGLKNCLFSNALLIKPEADQVAIKQQLEKIKDVTRVEASQSAKGRSFLNIYFRNEFVTKQPAGNQPQDLEKPQAQDDNLKGEVGDKKYLQFTKFLDAHIPYKPVAQPKHVYTISINRPAANEEAVRVYSWFKAGVFKTNTNESGFLRNFCKSAIFDQEHLDEERYLRESQKKLEENKGKILLDEGLFTGLGTFHMYHRIDGELVAVGHYDITPSVLHSGQFMYNPVYSFLSLGVVGAIHEIEYMKRIKREFLPSLSYYNLSDFQINCPKINYKLNYRPAEVLCPSTKQWLRLTDRLLARIKAIAAMSIEEKKSTFGEMINLASSPAPAWDEAKAIQDLGSLRIEVKKPSKGTGAPELMYFKDYVELLKQEPAEKRQEVEWVQEFAAKLAFHLGVEFVKNRILLTF